MKRILQTELLEEIRDDINEELEARQNIKVAEQTPTNKESAPCSHCRLVSRGPHCSYECQHPSRFDW